MLQQFNFQNKLSVIVDEKYDVPFFDVQNNIIFIPIVFNYMDELVVFIRKYPFADLRILSTSLITDEVLWAIRDNQNIFSIYLGSKDDPYVLTRDVFDILNQSESLFNICTHDVIGNFSNSEMEYLPFFKSIKVGQYYASDLVSLDSFHFYESLNEKEIDYLSKYLRNGVSIYFEYQDYDNILKIISQLREKNINFNIPQIKLLSDYINDFKIVIEQGEKISIIHSMNLDKYFSLMSYMKLMVKDIVESDLSTYERYLAVYEMVTHYKKYLENNRNFAEARELKYILFNNFIVCEGFSNLFVALLELVGIPACNIDVSFYKNKENPTLEQQAQLGKSQLELLKGDMAYHSRVLIRLIDSKYNIDGIFVADPTWDNSLEDHYFNHSLMTPYETSLENIEFKETGIEILNVNSSKEFLDKVFASPSVLENFIELIKKIDFNYYTHLKKKYRLDIEQTELLLDVYNYIVSYTKRRVSHEIRTEALNVLFHFIYSDLTEEEIAKFLESLQKNNQQREELFFNKGGR